MSHSAAVIQQQAVETSEQYTTSRQMSSIGLELLTKATLCAAAMALLAGITAAILGS